MKKKKIKIIIPLTFLFIFLIIVLLINILPEPKIKHYNHIEFYNSQNKIMHEQINQKEGKYIGLEQINPKTIECFIAIEDKRFYNHIGFDLTRIFKSLLENIKANEIRQGASTITQQLAKNLYLDNEKSYNRKLKEILLALRIENFYSKEEILEAYFNHLYFGHGIYGIENAAYYFFATSAFNLSISQSAILIGIINSPSIYSPIINFEKSKEKQEQILNLLLENNNINLKEYNQAINEEIILNNNKNKSINNAKLFYLSLVKHELNLLNIKENEGLKVYTYYEEGINNILNNLLSKVNFKNKDSNICVQISVPYSNKIIASIGGIDYHQNSIHCGYNSKRQIGSTIKPFIYYLGIDKGMNVLTSLTSSPTTFFIKNFGAYEVSNNNNLYAFKKINMLQAIAFSDNIYAVKTGLFVGSSALENLFNNFGYSYNHIPSSFLGSIELSNLELLNMYNTLASEGLYYPLSTIKEVYDSNGTLLYKNPNSYKRIMDKNSTLILNYALKSTQDNLIDGYTKPSMINYKTNNCFAIKTGTTSQDNYCIGYNPEYTISVWVGNMLGNNLDEPGVAKKIFQNIANNISSNNTFYSPSPLLISKKIDPNTGLESNGGSTYLFKRF